MTDLRSPTGLGPRSALGVIEDLLVAPVAQDGRLVAPIRTGFDLLDRVLDGGLRLHDLVLIGGNPGVGKTVAALQMAGHIARAGQHAAYFSYEHDDEAMLGRLLAAELGELATSDNAPDLDRLRKVVVDATAGYRPLGEVIEGEPLVAQAYERLRAYGDRLLLMRSSGAHTDLAAIEAVARALPTGVLVVDYLQKVAVRPEPANEAEKVTHIAEGLKDLALRLDVTVVALVAGDREGLDANRLRLHHLRGSSALAYECDVAVILNDKHRSVSRAHLAYDPVRAESFKQQVVFSVEKNRGGPAMVDLEFRKDFLHYRFDPRGNYLVERLADDRLEVG